MGSKSIFFEKQFLNRSLRRLTTPVTGTNASTTNILVTTSASFIPGDIILTTGDSTYHLVTAIPDGTHITFAPASAAAVTTGNVQAIAFTPQIVYVALFTANPTEVSDAGTEVTGGSYLRVAVTQADTSWSAPAGNPAATNNSGTITFPAPTANWGVVTGVGVYDSLNSSGSNNLIYWGALTVNKTVNNGDPAPLFNAAALSISED